MAAVYVNNLVINAGCTFSQSFSLESIDTNSAFNLVGYAISAQMRKWSGSSSAIDFSTNIDATSSNSLVISLTADQTKDLKPGRYVYDVVIYDDYETTTRIIEGMVLLREGVTR